MNISAERLRLYAVTDRAWLAGQPLEAVVQELLAAGVTCVQLREKHASEAEFLALAKALKPVCARYRAPLLINDSVAVAKAADVDGVHVGQSDMAVAEARRILGPDKIIGASAHSVAEALAAQEQGADYLGCGAVFGTSTKTDVTALARDELRRICEAVRIPVVAIGGISAQNAPLLAGTGIAGLAVVSALFTAPDKTASARQMRVLADQAVQTKEPAGPAPESYSQQNNG